MGGTDGGGDYTKCKKMSASYGAHLLERAHCNRGGGGERASHMHILPQLCNNSACRLVCQW